MLIVTTALASCSGSKKVVQTKKQQTNQIQETVLDNTQQSEFEYIFIEGLKQKHQGNIDGAQQMFSRCLEIDPLSAVCMFEMGKIHYAKKDITSATLLLEKARDINPNNQWYTLLLAQVYQQSQKFGEAAKLYESLYKTDSKNITYLYTQAVLLGMNKDYDAAIKTYDKLAEKGGMNVQIAVAKQNIYLERGDNKSAIKEIEKLIEKNPNNPTFYGLMAELYQKQGNNEKALEYYNKIFEIDPENGFAYISLANFYVEQSNFSEAYKNLKLAFESNNLDADTKIQYYLLQLTQEEQSPWTNSQIDSLLEILREKYPNDDRMLAVYADNLLRQGKLDEARDNVRKFLNNNPQSYDMWAQYLIITNELQEWDRLISDCNDALKLFPKEASVHMFKALGYLMKEEYQPALDAANKGLEYTGENIIAQMQLEVFVADANYQLGNIDAAIDAYAKVIETDPNNYAAMNNYAYYLAQEKRNLDDAEKYANKAIQANPTSSTYLDTYAWVLFRKGDYKLAKFYQETAISNNVSNSGTIVEHYGDILFMLGEKEKAIEQWKKAKEMGDASKILDEKIRKQKYIEEK